MSDTYDIGPFRLSDLSLQQVNILSAGARVSLENSLWDVFVNGKPLEFTVQSAELRGNVTARSRVEVPRLGLDGSGHYSLELDDFSIQNDLFRARIQGILDLRSGPLQVHAHI